MEDAWAVVTGLFVPKASQGDLSYVWTAVMWTQEIQYSL